MAELLAPSEIKRCPLCGAKPKAVGTPGGLKLEPTAEMAYSNVTVSCSNAKCPLSAGLPAWAWNGLPDVAELKQDHRLEMALVRFQIAAGRDHILNALERLKSRKDVRDELLEALRELGLEKEDERV